MLLVSTGFKAAILGPQSFADIFNGGEIRVFAGVRPINAELAEPSVPLGVIHRIGALAGLMFVVAGANVVTALGDEWMLNVAQPGNPAWFRLVAAGDTGGYVPSAPRIDGDVSLVGAGGDMTIGEVPLVAGTSVPIDGFWYTLPPLPGS